jgi:hypothetical protein
MKNNPKEKRAIHQIFNIIYILRTGESQNFILTLYNFSDVKISNQIIYDESNCKKN